MKKFSVVIPAYNEEKYLEVTLPSVFRLEPDEVLLILDRPQDRSRKVARRIAEKYRGTLSIKEVWEKVDWKLRQAYLRCYGFENVKNDVILSTDADFVLDNEISNHIIDIEKRKYGLISFGILDYPLSYRSISSAFLSMILKQKSFAGPALFSKNAFIQTRDDDLKNWVTGDDIYLRKRISTKYPVKHVFTKTWHLRPNEDVKQDYIGGMFYYKNVTQSKLRMFIVSMLLFKPFLFMGFIHAFHRNARNCL